MTDKAIESILAECESQVARERDDEPLANGQTRLAQFYQTSDWEIVSVHMTDKYGFLLVDIDGGQAAAKHWHAIGPVIQPPPDSLSS